jgi:eukaryotic-like serine/threonine-protein kinase
MSTQQPLDDLIGCVLGGAYQVCEKIGVGGMGSVYRADHARLPKSFAVKVLNEAVETDSELYHRFRREAEVCSRLKHEHIVEVVDFNLTEDGRPYIVMELLDGEDLGDRLERVGRLSLTQTTQTLGQVSAALGEAHAQGVVHRDMKPQNIFLCRRRNKDDYVKLVDFGISKIQGAGSMLTATNATMGTPCYMSPEQTGAGDTEVDHRTDVYALGVIAFQMLTGDVPFRGDNFAQLVLNIVMKPPGSVTAQVPDLPAAVDAVIQCALAKDPGARFQTVADFDHALQSTALGADWDPAAISQPPSAAAGSLAAGSPATATAPSPSAHTMLADAPTTLSGASGQRSGLALPTPERKGRPVALLLGLGGAAAAAVLLVVLILSYGGRSRVDRASSPAGRTTPAVDTSASSPPRGRVDKRDVRAISLVASRVVIHLRGLPRGAVCRVNSRVAQDNPLVLDRSDRPVTLHCEARGHRPFTHKLTPDKDTEVQVSMPSEPARAVPDTTPGRRHRARPRGSSMKPPRPRPRRPPSVRRPMRPSYDDVPTD